MENRLLKSRSCLGEVLQNLTTQEKNRNYIEAQKLKNQAQKIQKQIQDLQKKQTKHRHKKEQKQIITIQDEEITKFNEDWVIKIKELKKEGNEMIEQQKIRHNQQLSNLEKQFEQQCKNYHDSGAVILLRKKQQKLAKQQKFMEAHKIQQQRLKLQNQEKQALKKLHYEKVKTKLKQLKMKQETQKQILKKKIQSKIEEQNKKISEQQQILTKKHKNTLRQFTGQKQKENLSQSRMLKNSIYLSRSISPSLFKIKSKSNFMTMSKSRITVTK